QAPEESVDARPAEGEWIVLGGEMAARLADQLEAVGGRATLAALAAAPALRGVIALFEAPERSDASGVIDEAAAATAACRDALAIVQAALALPGVPRIWLVTRGAQSVVAGDTVPALALGSLWGLGRVAQAEHPELRCTLVDIDGDGAIAALLDELLADDAERQLAIRSGVRH